MQVRVFIRRNNHVSRDAPKKSRDLPIR